VLTLMKSCAPWLTWKHAGVAALVIGGIVLCTGLPSLGVLAGAVPLLLMVACLVPCLAPLVLLRRRRGAPASGVTGTPLTAASEQDAGGCRCGGTTCATGLGAARHATQLTDEAARS